MSRLPAAFAALVSLIVACGPRASRIDISPAAVTIRTHGGEATIKAVPIDARGSPMNDLAVSWSSWLDGCGRDEVCRGDPVASVDAFGQVHARRYGTVVIEARAGGAAGSCKVSSLVPATLRIAAATPMPATGIASEVQVIGTTNEVAGGFEAAAPGDQPSRASVFVDSVPVELASSAPAVLRVDRGGVGGGVLTPLAPGVAILTARNGDLSVSTPITVTKLDFDGLAPGLTEKTVAGLRRFARSTGSKVSIPGRGPATQLRLRVGDERPLTAFATRGGEPLVPVAAHWLSSAARFVSVTPSGVATAVAPGKAILTATFDGIRGELPVTVTRLP